jgi:uncharacterized membrane protein
MKTTHLCLVVASALGAIACGNGLPDVDCSGTIPQYADVTALTKCSTCHSSKITGSARRDAPTSVNFDTESAARSHAEDAASEVNGGDMPPSGSGISLSADEKQALYKWALCK